ncbi:MAG TPA: hypothetical protein VJ829_04060, partial [Candidatus Binatia bacterium]|nr:hypothetical protein [Candidatus Binatia bacterium]
MRQHGEELVLRPSHRLGFGPAPFAQQRRALVLESRAAGQVDDEPEQGGPAGTDRERADQHGNAAAVRADERPLV